ncbi:MAG: hypothetical protein ACD_4C00205G0004 [uncultured bacterium (gcode 4)]|uniref:Uncharacterized protein n=1 Tax=uncultured bacterium (gcode 4) TaxID=1234023 RepID=K2G965_9BACT|nr:MAG: hypothetical protein ACD_4C00205G0004 [uncultured bacterium (gcode 4)]
MDENTYSDFYRLRDDVPYFIWKGTILNEIASAKESEVIRILKNSWPSELQKSNSTFGLHC